MRLPTILLLTAIFTSIVQAQNDDRVADLRRRADALRRMDYEGTREELLAFARDAMDCLPGAEGNDFACRALGNAILSGALEVEEAWGLAMRLRKRILDQLDLVTGGTFLCLLGAADPDRDYHYRRDAAWLCAAFGLVERAVREYGKLLILEPGDVDVALSLMSIYRGLDDPGRALDVCDSVIERTGSARLHLVRGALLWRHMRDADAAREALQAARRAAADLPEAERAAFLTSVAAEEEALRATVDRAVSVREHLAFLDRALVAIGLAWLLLIGGVAYYGVRAKRTQLADHVRPGV